MTDRHCRNPEHDHLFANAPSCDDGPRTLEDQLDEIRAEAAGCLWSIAEDLRIPRFVQWLNRALTRSNR